MPFAVPPGLVESCRRTGERSAWLGRLGALVDRVTRRWSLRLGPPFDDATCGWVAPATRADGSAAILKLGMPHAEGLHETQGLRYWQGNPTVVLLDADDETGAMLLEACEPGYPLRVLPEPEQDVVIADLLRVLWRPAPPGGPFRPLSSMVELWTRETLADRARWGDAGIVRDGLVLLADLASNGPSPVLLATDLHAGNVLRAKRKPWLMIDPKPFVGDPAYDATQHLFNCPARMNDTPRATISRVADRLLLDETRVRLWMFARAAAEPRDSWVDDQWTAVARAIAP